jgi:hypothetical protein
VKIWKTLLLAPLVLALAMAPQSPQDPAAAPAPEPTAIARISALQYVNCQGTTVTVPARNVVEIRLLEDHADAIRLELLYDNGDYSLIDAQALHLLRNSDGTREVKLIRGTRAGMRFPKLP